jgi:hypothetical protein
MYRWLVPAPQAFTVTAGNVTDTDCDGDVQPPPEGVIVAVGKPEVMSKFKPTAVINLRIHFIG